jgi:hypothetical protein
MRKDHAHQVGVGESSNPVGEHGDGIVTLVREQGGRDLG